MSRPQGHEAGAVRRRFSKRMLAATPLVLSVAVATACGSSGGSSSAGGGGKLFPAKGIRMIVASSAGGGFDRSTRQIQPAMAKALGTKLNLEYQSSADGAVAQSILAKAPDCNTIVSSADPKVVLSQYIQKVNYTYEKDFASIGGFTRDYAVFMVQPNSQYKTLQDLVTAAKAKPKGITVAVGSIASDGKAVVAFEDAVGVKFNIVPFGGGTDANNALLGGKAPVAESSVFNSLALKGKVTVIGVMAGSNPIPSQTNNAPTVKAALGIDMPDQVNNYGLFVSSACKTKFPKQYAALQSALQSALNDPSFKSTVDKLGLTGWYVFTPAAQYDQEIISEEPALQQFVAEQNLAPK
jgi:tripartite-type tricarboxylate transporter receptor subunit TctC